MTRKRISLVFFLCIFCGAIDTPLVHGEVCNRIVAIVNDDVITLYELEKRIEEVTGRKPSELKNEDYGAYLEGRRRILALLIDEKVIQHQVKEMGFESTEEEVASSIARIKASNQWTHVDLLAAIQSQGLTFEKFRERIKQDLEKNKLIDYEVKSKVIITDEAVKQYYDKHMDDYSSDGTVRLAIIYLPAETPSSLQEMTDNIASLLKNGEDFGELAKKYSKGPNAKNGGDLGTIQLSQLDPKLERMVENMSEGEASQPIVGSSGVQFFKLIEKREKGIDSLEEVKNDIEDVLYQEEIQALFSSWIKELREKAYIKITF